MSNGQYADTGQGKKRRRLTVEEAEAGFLPAIMLKGEWKAAHLACKKYERDIEWKKFQYFLQKVERAKEKREKEG